jgi:WD40 repeat protein
VPVGGPADPNASIPIAGFGGQTIFPTRPSDFVALNPPGGKDLAPFQMYDLRAMQPVGRPLGANGNAFGPYSRFALSPDGKYFAARAQGNPPTTVEVWSVITGDRLHGLDLGVKPGFAVGAVDFLGKDRLLVTSSNNDFGMFGDATYQTWDLESGKKVAEFSSDVIFNRKWCALSPGGRYLVQEKRARGGGHDLLFWEPAAGKLAADIEYLGKTDPGGYATGLAFSPDGEEVALLLRLGKKPDAWGRLLSWDVRTGKKLADHRIGWELSHIDAMWGDGGTIEWCPDRSGWLLFGYLLVDHDSGAVVWKFPPEPHHSGEFMTRHFLDRDHVTTEDGVLDKRRLRVETLPREQIDAAVKAARGK